MANQKLLLNIYTFMKNGRWLDFILKALPIVLIISAIEVGMLDGHLFATDWRDLLNHKKMFVRELTILMSLNFLACSIGNRLIRNASIILIFLASFIISAIDVIKTSETAIPFLISDIFVARHAQSLLLYVLDSRLTILGICFIIFLMFSLSLLKYLRKVKKTPVIGSFLTCFLMSCYFLSEFGPYPIYNMYWDYRQSARFNGFLVYQYLYVRDLSLKPPSHLREEISKLEMKQDSFCSDWQLLQSIPTRARNTAIILLESFWDLESAGYRFNQPVAPNFQALVSQHYSNRIIVPTFGGHTANAEFEILTGLSAKFFPSGSVIYTDYLKRPTPSLVGMLKSAGYNTLATHNFHKWFWHRDQVYKTIGFDKFVGLDEIGHIKWTQNWPEDGPLFDEILGVLKEHKSPQFIFGITVNSHGPYGGGVEAEDPIREGYDPNGQPLTEPWLAYANKIHRLDFELGRFINKANQIVPKPLIVLFGDHLPSIAKDVVERMYENRIVYVNAEKPLSDHDAIMPLHCATVDIIEEIALPMSPFYESKREWCRQFEIERESHDTADDYAITETGKAYIYDRVIGANQTVPFCLYPNRS